MKNGGYIIADFKGETLTSGQETNITGLFQSVSNPYKKPVLVSGLIVGDVEYPDFYTVFTSSSDGYTSTVVIGSQTVTIEVNSGDDVTVTVA